MIAASADINARFVATTAQTSDITGYYFFVGKPPKAFQDVHWLSFAQVDANGHRGPLNGFIRLKTPRNGKFVNFFLIRPKLNGRVITFSTRVVRGVSYEFKGEFLKLIKLQDNEIVLKGLLSKFRNGRKVAEFTTRYSYYTGD